MLRDVVMLMLGFGLVVSVGRGRQRRALRPAGLSQDLRDRFLSTVSHELRTPLNAIIGWAQMLKTGCVQPADISRAIDAIDRNARVQARMVDDLLDVSRMRRGCLPLSRVPVDFTRVAEDIVASMRPAIEAKGVRLSTNISRAPIVVLGDEIRLRQLVQHVIGNSAKFTPAGGHIDVRLVATGRFALFGVHDDGIGIGAKDLTSLREPFYQASPRPMRCGLGLGLTLVAELVDRHGGTLDIESAGTGTGTQVEVRLPITQKPSS